MGANEAQIIGLLKKSIDIVDRNKKENIELKSIIKKLYTFNVERTKHERYCRCDCHKLTDWINPTDTVAISR